MLEADLKRLEMEMPQKWGGGSFVLWTSMGKWDLTIRCLYGQRMAPKTRASREPLKGVINPREGLWVHL